MVAVSASVLAADSAALQDEIATVATADRIHLDMMDGHFVPNLAFGFSTAERLTECTDLPIDLHLMVSNPQRHVGRLGELDVASVTVHVETTDDVPTVCEQLRREGKTPGIALNPDTDIEAVKPVVDAADRITVMGVRPGFSGQSFVSGTVGRVERIRQEWSHRIEVDGGVDTTVASACVDAGADILVSGSTIFGSADRQEAIRRLRSSE
jgi:ribulose-phosphate 3-epimerase